MPPGLFSLPSVMDIHDVTEVFSRYNVDPGIAQRTVPSRWKVKIHDNGAAVLLVMVQLCGKMVLDRLANVGSVGMSHIWIELEGPEETVTPLPGTTRSLPTWYWYILPHQLDRRLVRSLFGLAGVSARRIRSVCLTGDPGGTRVAEITGRKSASATYSVTEKSRLYDEPDIVTGSHRFFREYGKRTSEAHAKCITHFLGDGEAILSATSESTVGRLGLGTSLQGVSNPVWVKHCRVEYRVSYL